MNELVLIDEDSDIKKSEVLVKSRYKLKPLAIKLITSLISAVQDKDTPEQEYIFSVSNFTDLGELKGRDYYKKLDEATDELYKPFKINVKGKDWTKINWVHTCKYMDGEGVIKFKLHPDILPMIKNLKKGNYLKYDLVNILRLRSEYSIRMYEFLKDEYNKNARYSKKAEALFTVDYLRERLDIPKSYGFEKVRERILDKAQSDLLSNCDIKFDWEVAAKLGKRVHSIKFKIYPNAKNMKDSIKLPSHLENFMKYKNYLNDKYKGNGKYFFVSKFEINNSKKVYFFGINEKGLVYAMGEGGGSAVNMTKEQSQTIRNASYLSAHHSELYRELISDEVDFWELKNDTENKELYGLVQNGITSVLKEYDARQAPLI